MQEAAGSCAPELVEENRGWVELGAAQRRQLTTACVVLAGVAGAAQNKVAK